MAKRKQLREEREAIALNRKQLARERREKKARRRVFWAAGVLIGIVVTILVVAIVNEFMVKPGQPVALVDDTTITTAEFQERVRLERNQTIDLIYQYAELFGVEQVYGIAGQLDDYEALGERVLDNLIDEVLIQKAAAEMGFTVSEDKAARAIEEREGYYRDGTPTPLPTFTPRPSPTPITDTVVTPYPTTIPQPTPTAVTEEAFQTTYRSFVRALDEAGVDEETFRTAIKMQLLQQEVREYLMKDEPTEAVQVQLSVLLFASEQEAENYLARLDAGELFESLVEEARADTEDSFYATTVPWTTFDGLAERYNSPAAQIAFALELGDHSQVISTEDGQHHIFHVTGHEMRELSTTDLRNLEENLFSAWLEGLRASAEIEKKDYWRKRVPKTPELDTRRLIPTPTQEG